VTERAKQRRIRVGVAGTGFSATVHLDALRRLPGVEVVAIAGSDIERARAIADQERIPHAYAGHAELLDHDGLDAIHNCTVNRLHHEVSLAALERGLHVLSEKPLAIDRARSAELVAAADRAGVVAAVCFNYRHYPMVAELRARLARDDYGRPHFVHGSYLQDWLLESTDWNWRLDPAEGGSSRAVADIGSHWMDLAQHVTGERIVEVFADLRTLHETRRRPAQGTATFGPSGNGNGTVTAVDTEDYGTVLLRFASGARGSFQVSQTSAGRKNALSLDVDAERAAVAWRQEDPNRAWIGRRGDLNLELVRDPGHLDGNAARLTRLPAGHPEGWLDALGALVGQFYVGVRAHEQQEPGPADLATFEQGHALVCLVDAIVDSHRDQRWVGVPSGSGIPV
jgi:predicted dehydrogenase